MKFSRMSVAGLLAAALGLAGSAQASDNIYWSVGVAQPGISVGVSNAPPVMAYPAPVMVPAYPVYPAYRVVVPRPVYYAPPAPVYYGPPPGWGHGHHGHGRGHGHGYGHGRRHG